MSLSTAGRGATTGKALAGHPDIGMISFTGSVETGRAVMTAAAQNITGHPAISLPAGFSANGVPFGLMATGPRFRDAMLLDFAATWELARPWPLAASGYEPFDAALR